MFKKFDFTIKILFFKINTEFIIYTSGASLI